MSTVLPLPPPMSSAALFEQQYQVQRSHKQRMSLMYGAVFLLALGLSAWVGEFNPIKVLEGLPRVGEYVMKTLPSLGWATLGHDIAEWFWGLPKWLKLLWETVLIAYLGTLLGTLGALLLCFDASENLKRHSAVYWVSRRVLEISRTVPELVFALVFVFAFGLGPLAGVLAIAIHSMGGNGKLYAEAVENIDMKPVDGLRAAGASWLQTVRYAVLPQVLPNFTSFALWRFEINVRAASVVGFVGAGGIGQEFYTAIRMLYYEDISAMIILLVGTVIIIDMVCERLRHRMIGNENLS
jgi:phosphonate transport system permease protein